MPKFDYEAWKKQLRERINKPKGDGRQAAPLLANLKNIARGNNNRLTPPEIK